MLTAVARNRLNFICGALPVPEKFISAGHRRHGVCGATESGVTETHCTTSSDHIQCYSTALFGITL